MTDIATAISFTMLSGIIIFETLFSHHGKRDQIDHGIFFKRLCTKTMIKSVEYCSKARYFLKQGWPTRCPRALSRPQRQRESPAGHVLKVARQANPKCKKYTKQKKEM